MKIDMTGLMNMFNSYMVLLVPVITLVTAKLKQYIPDEHRKRWTPALSLAVGVALSILLIGRTIEAGIVGVLFGLSASGLWSNVKTPLNAVKGRL